jgi:hypothetical protein
VIFLDFAKSVVAQYAPVGIKLGFRRILVMSTKGGDFDYVSAEADVNQAKSTPYDAAVFKQGTHFFRRGISGHVKILGLYLEQ